MEGEEVESEVEMFRGTMGLDLITGGAPLPLYLSQSTEGMLKFLRWNSSAALSQRQKGSETFLSSGRRSMNGGGSPPTRTV